MSEVTPPCLALARKLYAAIEARMTGEQVQSVNHKSRGLEYAQTSLKDMVNAYINVWNRCADAQAELPELQPIDGPTAKRGRPVVRIGGGRAV